MRGLLRNSIEIYKWIMGGHNSHIVLGLQFLYAVAIFGVLKQDVFMLFAIASFFIDLDNL